MACPRTDGGGDSSGSGLTGALAAGHNGLVENANRGQYIDAAKKELDAAVASKKITQQDANIRLEVVKAALSGKLSIERDEAADARDPSLWETDPATGELDRFVLRPTPSASAALDSAFAALPGHRIGYWCRGAAQLDILRGQEQAAGKAGIPKFDTFAMGKSPASLFPEYNNLADGKHMGNFTECERNANGIDPKTLLPGDQTWVKDSLGSGTEAGSNKFYIGGGLYAEPYSNSDSSVSIFDYQGYLDFVHAETGHPDISTLSIIRVGRPIVPSY